MQGTPCGHFSRYDGLFCQVRALDPPSLVELYVARRSHVIMALEARIRHRLSIRRFVLPGPHLARSQIFTSQGDLISLRPKVFGLSSASNRVEASFGCRVAYSTVPHKRPPQALGSYPSSLRRGTTPGGALTPVHSLYPPPLSIPPLSGADQMG